MLDLPQSVRNSAEDERGSGGRMFTVEAEALASLPLFRDLDRAILRNLTAASSLRSLAAKVRILREGEIPRNLHIVIKGMVELTARRGRRQYGIMILTPGDVFMPAAALFDEPYLNSAYSLTRVSLLELDVTRLRYEASRSAQLALLLAQVIAGQWRMALRHVLDLKCRNGPERLAALLLRFVEYNPGSEGGELPFPKRHLAARVGMTPETLSRSFQILASNGLHVRGHRIIVKDRKMIESFCGKEPYPGPDEYRLGVHVL